MTMTSSLSIIEIISNTVRYKATHSRTQGDRQLSVRRLLKAVSGISYLWNGARHPKPELQGCIGSGTGTAAPCGFSVQNDPLEAQILYVCGYGSLHKKVLWQYHGTVNTMISDGITWYFDIYVVLLND